MIYKNIIDLGSRRPLASSGISNVLISGTGRPSSSQVSFDRRELNIMLRIYSMKVASGEWRDYAIDCLSDRAIFSIYRRARQTPLFQIIKDPKLMNRQGIYSVVNESGRILKRGKNLEHVVRVLERHFRVIAS